MSTSITISKQIAIQDEGVLKTSDVNSIDFTGAGITATNVGNAVTVNVPQNLIQTLDESASLTSTTQSLNFTGAGVTATAVGDAVTVNVPGGGGGEVTGLQSAVFSSLFAFRTSNALTAINTTGHATNDGMQYFPYIPNTTFTCVEFSINVTTAQATGSARICVYNSINNAPANLVFSSADLSCSTTGTKPSGISSFVFTQGTTYWLGLQANLGSINVTGLPGDACIPIGNSTTGTAVTCWIQVGLTYSSGAPSVANVNSYTFNTSPQILMKK
jgi:hypothetical protein